MWCWMRWVSVEGLFVSEQKRWREVLSVMFVWHVMLDEVSECWRFGCKWAKEVKRSVVSNVCLACDVGWGEWVLRFVCKWAKEVKRSVISNVRLACDVGWGEWVLRFVCKWAKEVKRSVLSNVRLACDVGWGEWVLRFVCKWVKRGEEKCGE